MEIGQGSWRMPPIKYGSMRMKHGNTVQREQVRTNERSVQHHHTIRVTPNETVPCTGTIN